GLRLVNYWPSVFVQSTGEDSEAFYPSGLWTTDGISLRPLTSAEIPVGPTNRPTLGVIQGSGWRLNSTIVRVQLNGNPCTVVAARASSLFAGQDELVFQIPTYLAGSGPMDLIVSVGGRESNFARINLGAAASLTVR
ncbi:MAG: IPT/TIG domain-containing protein, partial [Blastocatellia bacterium]